MLKTTKIIISQKKEKVNTPQELLSLYQVSFPNLTEQALHIVDCRTTTNAFQTIGIYTENKEELEIWKSFIQEYDKDADKYEYDFYTFFCGLAEQNEFLADVLGERDWDGLFKTNLYTFEF